MFYSPATDADFDGIDGLGGVAAQYLSHLDEAGPNLARVADRFGRGYMRPQLSWTPSSSTRTSTYQWKLEGMWTPTAWK